MLIMNALIPLIHIHIFTHAYLYTLYVLLDQLSTFLTLTFIFKLDPENTPASGATPLAGVKVLTYDLTM